MQPQKTGYAVYVLEQYHQTDNPPFGGGVIAIFGARLADGCPSGHGLSGLMQLAVSSFIALGMFLIVGFLMAHVIYTGRKQ